MAGNEKCFICEEDINNASDDVSNMGAKGIKTLSKASIERNDSKFEYLKDVKALKVHTLCRKNYTRPDSIKAHVSQKLQLEASSSIQCDEQTTLRSSLPKFDFKTSCFFCTDLIDDEVIKKEKKKPIEKRRLCYAVRNLSLKEKVIDAAGKRKDQWADEVKLRLSNVSDLVAAEAIYHQDCFTKFFSHTVPTGKRRGRPEADYVVEAMEEIHSFLENNDECQHLLSKLMSKVTGTIPDERTVKIKLKEKYKERIIITNNKKMVPTVCFLDTGMKILSNSWYENRNNDEKAERLRIVQTAAAIIREDIQSQLYDTTCYPPSDNFLKDAYSCIPETLQSFLDHVIHKEKDTNVNEKKKKKSVSIAHAIVSAVRPRSFVSSLLSSLSALLYRKYGSRNLINLISSMGFCSSYHDAQQLEISAIYHPPPNVLQRPFCQFVFDNADFNVSTVDGMNTFHAMGGIKCITPGSMVANETEITKVIKIPSAEEIAKLGYIPLQVFENTGTGLGNVTTENLQDLNPLTEDIPLPNVGDTLWMCAKFFDIPGVPEWKGYMHCVTSDKVCEKTKVVPLPFINSPPTNYNTIYTALQLAADECIKNDQKTLIVTFDQPLYWKCREIVEISPMGSQLSSCVVRLGGFHLLMSYLGCIGYLMAGSGLKELLSTIYAPASVSKMLEGHAYSRAIRAHLLIQTALARIILDEVDISVLEQDAVNAAIKDILTEPPSLDTLNQNLHLVGLATKLGNKLEQIKGNGPTAALWIQYFNMVTLMKEYICAERSGDWNVHLNCVQQMIPFFHACGHFAYAKSCHLYLQDMFKLPSVMPKEEFEKFVSQGFFTMRRNDSFWSGVWSDMTIEQTLMRSMKSTGGLTRGRGVSDSVLSKWILGTTATHDICTSLEQFSGVQFFSTEQHVDFREARQKRDLADVAKLTLWLENHPPFPVVEDIMSLETGVIGEGNINCYNAISVGKRAMAEVVGKCFSDVKLSRKNKALPLACVNCSIKINNDVSLVDPHLLFKRIAIAKQTSEDLIMYLEYELAPFPLALFNEVGMRKTKKSALYDLFTTSEKDINLETTCTVVDGGFLLHRVIWSRNSTFALVCMGYVTYILKHYGTNCTVVFDGYSNVANSTKNSEQNRRYNTKKSVDIHFGENTVVTTKQDQFLSNEKNKSRLISMLSAKLKDNGIESLESSGDADTLIIRTAIDKCFTSDNVVIVGEDVDLLVLLTALAPDEREIFLVKPKHGKIEKKVYSSKQLQESGLKNSILFLHAFSGCDTTSALYKRGKTRCSKIFQQRQDLHDISGVFTNHNSTHEAIAEAGTRFFLGLYGANIKETNLNLHRYNSFVRSVTNIKPDISSLPPTAGAAKQHSFRVYHQVQLWLGNELPPELWGWKCVQNRLVPITTEDAVAPDKVLNLIFCRCATGCGVKCGCRKAAMKCSTVCNTCHGDCLNGIVPAIYEEDEEDLLLDTIDYTDSSETHLGYTPPTDDAPRRKIRKL